MKTIVHRPKISLIVFFVMLGLFVCFALTQAEAADYYVADPKGIDGIRGTVDDVNSSDNYAGTETQPFATFAKACSVVAPGDNVVIRGGTYNEILNPRVSGTAGNPIAFKAYPGETVTITELTHGLSLAEALEQEPDQYGLQDGFYMYKLSYITLVGLTVKDVGGFTRIAYSDHIVIRECNFSNATDGGLAGAIYLVHSDYNTISNNTITKGNNNIALIHSDRNLVVGNHITSGKHGLFEIQASNFNVLRNNYFYNDIQKGGAIYDSYQIEPIEYNATKHNLFESNDFACTSGTDSAGLMAGIQYSAQEGIIRFNVFHDLPQVGLDLEVWPESAKYVSHNRVYNNVFNNMGFAGVWIQPHITTPYEMVDNIFKNNSLTNSVFVYPPGWPNQYGHSDSWAALVGKPVQFLTSRLTDFVCENNNFFGPGDDHYFITNSWPWTYPNPTPRTIAEWNTDYPALFKGNIAADPSYVDPDNHDFSLNAGSPLIDAGAFLTNTVEAGSGMTMPVADVRYFFDGYDMTDENGLPIPGDLVQLEGDKNTAHVIGIDYANNTLTLDQPLSWTNGQGVSLAYNDEAPDIGAYEYILYGDVNGNGGVDANDASLTAMAAVELITLTGEQVRKADVNKSGQPDANDASLIAQYAVGLIDKF